MKRAPRAMAIAVLAAAAAARADMPEQLRTPRAKPPVVQGVDLVEHLGERIPLDLRFRDAANVQLSLRDAMSGGKPVILTLVYFECPMLCNLVLQGLQQGLLGAGMQIGRDYRAITVSIDPNEGVTQAERHQTAMLRTIRQGAPADWPFLTGREPEIKALADSVGYQYRYDPQTKQFAHPAVVMVLMPDGRVSRYLYGIEYEAKELRLAMVEASQGKVGTTLDRVLLSCFRWDPSTRRYEVYLLGMIRIGGLLVFAALTTLLFFLWRGEWRRKRLQRGTP